MSLIAANLQAVRRRISEALQGDRREVRLIAVSKTRTSETIREALDAGCRDFGENYVQEALPKVDILAGSGACWHFIGPLQSNKAKDVALAFDWCHSIDRLKIAEALSRHRPAGRAPLEACIQVNISREATKSGVEADQALTLAAAVAKLPGLRLRGLMGIATPDVDPKQQRSEFAVLRGLLEAVGKSGVGNVTFSVANKEG